MMMIITMDWEQHNDDNTDECEEEEAHLFQ